MNTVLKGISAIFLGVTLMVWSIDGFAQQAAGTRGYVQYIRYPDSLKINLYFTDQASMTTYFSPTNARELPAFKNKKYSSKKDSLDDVPIIEQLNQTLKEHPLNPTVIYKRIQDGYYTVTKLDDNFKKYCIQDTPSTTPQWTLLPDTMTIAGLSCHKARGVFKNGVYDFWYAVDVPLPFGPEKLGGLPGLIMQVEGQNGYRLSAYKVQFPYAGNVVIAPCSNGIPITEHGYEELIKSQGLEQQKVLKMIDPKGDH